jgi:hypothetical protein
MAGEGSTNLFEYISSTKVEIQYEVCSLSWKLQISVVILAKYVPREHEICKNNREKLIIKFYNY